MDRKAGEWGRGLRAGCEGVGCPAAAGPCQPQQQQPPGTATGGRAASSSSTSALKNYFWPLHMEITCDEALIRACCSVTWGELEGAAAGEMR